MKKLFGFGLGLGMALPVAWIWGILSFGTSVAKRAMGDCGRGKYTIERYYVYGDLFCIAKGE